MANTQIPYPTHSLPPRGGNANLNSPAYLYNLRPIIDVVNNVVNGTQAFDFITVTGGATFGARNTYFGVTGITAFATGGQTNATLLSGEFNNVSIVATAGDSVKLPGASLGGFMRVKNTGVADLAVFPATGGTINGGSANASITIPVGATKEFNGTSTTNWETIGISTTAAGSASRPSHTFNSQSDQGLYSASATALGIAAVGAQVATFGSTGIVFNQPVTQKLTATTKSGVATLTAAEVATGLLVYTGNAQNITLPIATALATQLGAVQGTTFNWIVDNSGGSGTVTVVVGAGIVAASAVTGGTTLTLAQSTTVGSAGFRFTFLSATAAIISRLY